jgi:hypothetical protein
MMMMMMMMLIMMMMMHEDEVSSKPHKTCSRLRITITDAIIFYSCGKLHP